VVKSLALRGSWPCSLPRWKVSRPTSGFADRSFPLRLHDGNSARQAVQRFWRRHRRFWRGRWCRALLPNGTRNKQTQDRTQPRRVAAITRTPRARN